MSITEWDTHLYTMTIFFKPFKNVLDYTYDFLIMCVVFIPQNIKGTIRKHTLGTVQTPSRLSLSGARESLPAHPLSCDVPCGGCDAQHHTSVSERDSATHCKFTLPRRQNRRDGCLIALHFLASSKKKKN